MATEHDGEERIQPVRPAGTMIGALDDAAWDGEGDPASLIALWKGLFAQLALVAENTDPA